ncbi:polyamine ABC transporter substrate-binding protein [Roseinatronobacter alkalisoli]|uniref:Putrescine-binding periplasmic protein n=1 Tax=Roseinatronobacter alkalisoli TaxID=3028235 RepID=A0ABT5T770_9RHOB|nr:polyamine ABC transporter substrate-binding protein [Roseinatronobacter sp. HJB301]MDD7969798.1 polyamine ABC transporter substrate-binding protein [Roseinatronobacter sp. HJB301]
MRNRFILAVCAAMAAQAGAATADSINVFNWSDYIAPDTIEKFTAETGISVNYDVFDSNETLEARMLAGSSGFDVVVPTSDYMQRQIMAGVYQPLNRDLLPNLGNMDTDLMELAAAFDPGNEHSVIYLWGTTGIGYNTQAVAERLGEDYVVDSWSILFDPEKAALFQDCGIAWLDTEKELIPPAMRYLGLEPTSTSEEDFNTAADMLMQVRPTVRYFHSSQYISDLANGEICLAVGWSGDVLQAAERASETDQEFEVGYAIPDEGAHLWFDMLTIPVDAPNPEGAHAFINFIMDAQIAADITNYVMFPNANSASTPLIDEDVLNDPTVYPSDAARAGFWTLQPYDNRTERVSTRLWTRLRTGQ